MENIFTKSVALKYVTFFAALFFLVLNASGQTGTSEFTVKNYSVAKKRLLVITTAQYINFLTQNNLDQDSIKLIACQITGQPFLLIYSEYFKNQQASPGAYLINQGKIDEASKLLNNQRGETRILLLLELANWYLHQPGALPEHLNYAESYLKSAIKLSRLGNFANWQVECKFVESELLHQKKADQKSKDILSAIVNTPLQSGNELTTIRALQQMVTSFHLTDSSKLIYIDKAIRISRKQKFKEKEIELLLLAGLSHITISAKLLEQDMSQILTLMNSLNFKHNLYVLNQLSLAYILQSKNIEALQKARAALNNMEWSKYHTTAGSFYNRLGSCYWAFNKLDDALYWYKRSINSGSIENRLFWYKSVFFATTLLYSTGKPEQSLKLLDSVTINYPPVTLWEKFQVLTTKSSCYTLLNKTAEADKINLSVLDLANKNPSMDSFGELAPTYYEFAANYIARGNISRAKLFLKKGNERDGSIDLKHTMYATLYKIDSLEGNYKSALKNHILFKKYYDSNSAMDQRKKLDELMIKYETEKKDQDIKTLKQQRAVQRSELERSKLTQKIIIAGAGLLIIIILLLFKMFRIKQTTNQVINKKNQILEHLLHEKEWLLKEVHHRVKNNLHTVICLLESQAVYLNDDALVANENSQHRIYAMSLIHQKLYQSEDVKTIDMSQYLPEFTHYLTESFGIHRQVRIQLDIEPIALSISQAIPLALIVNEGVTNSIKHAFKSGGLGIITISLHQDENEIKFIVADNGIGIDPAILNRPSKSLGLKLINGLSEDINAKISVENVNGTRITVIFKVDPLNDGFNQLSGITPRVT